MDLERLRKELLDQLPTLTAGALSGGGVVAELEAALQRFTGAAHVLALSSATAGLRAALRLFEIQEGDDVVLPEGDWGASTGAIVDVGARPVPASVGPEGTVTASTIAQVLTPVTRMVIVTNQARQAAPVNEIRALCDDLGLPLLEDAARALGLYVGNDHVGRIGDAGVLSFGPGKPIDVGGGGALLLRDADHYRDAISMTQHPLRQLRAGLVSSDTGDNRRIDPVTAWLAVGRLESFRLKEQLRTTPPSDACRTVG